MKIQELNETASLSVESVGSEVQTAPTTNR